MSKKNNSTKTALVRVDYNVPIQNGQILDLKRIEASLPTINYLIKKNTPFLLSVEILAPFLRRAPTFPDQHLVQTRVAGMEISTISPPKRHSRIKLSTIELQHD